MGAPPQILLGSLSMADSLILMVLALVVFGPRKLPQIGRQIGKLMYEFRKASNDFKFQMEEELRVAEEADRRKKEEEERARNLALNPSAPTIEGQAALGAGEQASVSAQPSPYLGETVYPASTEGEPTETPAPTEESQVRYPRIQPPSTGEPVAAARPGSNAPDPAQPDPSQPDPAQPESSLTAEANIGAEPPPAAPSDPASQNPSTETVSQHG